MLSFALFLGVAVSEPIVFVSMPEDSPGIPSAGNLHDVAELFEHLCVEHLRYREFQLSEESSVFDKRVREVRRRATPRPRTAVSSPLPVANAFSAIEGAKTQLPKVGNPVMEARAVRKTGISLLDLFSTFGLRRWIQRQAHTPEEGRRDFSRSARRLR